MSDTEGRLIALEMALAHAERAGEDLSEVVRDQATQIDRLTQRMEAMARRLKELEEAAATSPGAAEADVRPPHW